MRLLLLATFGAALLLPACQRRTAPAAAVHYVVGAPYVSGGAWRYPRADFTFDRSGLAVIYAAHGRRTADGEVFDQTALAAGAPTLQLPALATLTNLANGRQINLRLNDRGPADPGRMVVITRRAAALLGAVGDAPIPVRLAVQETESRAMAAGLQGDAPALAVATAGTAAVQSESLAPPPGAAQAGALRRAAPGKRAIGAPMPPAPQPVPLRLPEAMRQMAVHPVALVIDCGGFGQPEYADILRARLARLGARTTTRYNAPRDHAYMVRIGPLPNLAAADAMLARARRAGATDARIAVE